MSMFVVSVVILLVGEFADEQKQKKIQKKDDFAMKLLQRMK